MPHFFISYAKKDTRELALQLNEALNAIPNVTAWVDKSLRAGRSWEIQIQTEIDRCDYMVVLYSPDINRHKQGEEESYMLSEIHYAKRLARKQIIPIMAQPTEPPMSLTMEQYIDFTLPNLYLDDLITAICDEVGIIKEDPLPPSTPPTAFSQPQLPVLERSLSGLESQAVDSNSTLPEFDLLSLVEETKSPSGAHDNLPVPTKPTSLSLMPTPFAWIDIPGKGYSIAKYPITNAQFAKFIDAGGYNNRHWWTEAGWSQREKDKRTQPRYWTDAKWNSTEQPVIGVSWYESLAFCLWMSEATGEKIMLPTEDQWQYAAQGDDGRDYPWGKNWDASRCNNNVDKKGIGKTTPVREYESQDKGDSPFGVVNMAGNVWEWCLTDYDNKTNDSNSGAKNRALRGGSWLHSNPVDFRCDSRHWSDPINWTYIIGFRVSRS